MNLPDAALEMQGKVIGLCGELNVALRKTFLSPHFPMHTCDSSMNARRILARKRVHGGSAVIRYAHGIATPFTTYRQYYYRLGRGGWRWCNEYSMIAA